MGSDRERARGLFWSDENVLNSIAVTVAQI